jgi:hypothetical protein
MIYDIFRQDKANRYMISLFGNKKDQNSWNRFTVSKPEPPVFFGVNLGHESDWFSQWNLEILLGIILGHEWRQYTKGISNLSIGQRDQRDGEKIPYKEKNR